MDKIGVTSGNAYDSLEHFAEYLKPSSPSRLDAMLPGGAWNQSQYYLRYYSSGPVCALPIRAFALKESSCLMRAGSVESRPTGTELNPFTLLRSEIDRVSAHGCRLNEIGGYKQPAGTFRRMHTSRGLIHADTVTLLNHGSGQFSANIYVQAPTGSGALSVYPAQQVTPGVEEACRHALCLLLASPADRSSSSPVRFASAHPVL